MTKFTDNLWRDLVEEQGPTIARAERPEPGRARRRRPRVLAGSTLAVAGVGAAVALVLTSTSGTPAFAVTTNSNGSVTVTINQTEALPQANAKLAAMGIHEQVTIYMASGPATVSGPVTCTPTPGVSGPTVKVLVGTNGTEVIKPGTSGDNTGVGTWHLASCRTTSGTGGTGNTGG